MAYKSVGMLKQCGVVRGTVRVTWCCSVEQSKQSPRWTGDVIISSRVSVTSQSDRAELRSLEQTGIESQNMITGK